MTSEELIKAGYKRWEPSLYKECVTDLFEKCVKDEKGKRYFIHIERWDFSPYERQGLDPIRFEATVQFHHKNGETVNIDALNGWSVEEMEKFYADLWNLGWFKYYEAFDGHRSEIESEY